MQGARLGLARSSARTGVKLVPWELAHAAVWAITLAGDESTPVHQALLTRTWLLVGLNAVAIGVGRRAGYDVVVGTRVVRGWCAGLTAGDFLASLLRHTAAVRSPSR